MNVTVHVSEGLRPAVDGRAALSLGLPPTASVADLVEALLILYPKLVGCVAGERGAKRAPLALFLPERAFRELSLRRGTLPEGTSVCLTGVAH